MIADSVSLPRQMSEHLTSEQQQNNNIGAIKINVWWYYAFNVMLFFCTHSFRFLVSTPKKRENAFFHSALPFEIRIREEEKRISLKRTRTTFVIIFFGVVPNFLLCICYYYYYVYHLYKMHETSVRIKSNPWDVLLLLMPLLLLMKMMPMPMPPHCLFRLFVSSFFCWPSSNALASIRIAFVMHTLKMC